MPNYPSVTLPDRTLFCSTCNAELVSSAEGYLEWIQEPNGTLHSFRLSHDAGHTYGTCLYSDFDLSAGQTAQGVSLSSFVAHFGPDSLLFLLEGDASDQGKEFFSNIRLLYLQECAVAQSDI